VLVLCGLVVGGSMPPVGSVVRPLLPRLLGSSEELLPTAYALDGIAIEMVFIVGPLLTGAIVSVASPAVALVVAAGFALAGTAVLITSPASRGFAPAGDVSERHLLGALASPGVRTLVATTAPVGFVLGASEVTLAAFATHHGSRPAAGLLLAVWAAGSGVGGLIYGAREHGLAPHARWLRLAVVYPIGYVPLIFAPSIPVMAVLAPFAGAGLAPLLAAANELIGDVAPPGAITEAFAWPITAIAIGAAIGSAVAGAIVQASSATTAFVVVVAAGALAAAIAVLRRRTVTVLGASPAA
jgi:MFS family permease